MRIESVHGFRGKTASVITRNRILKNARLSGSGLQVMMLKKQNEGSNLDTLRDSLRSVHIVSAKSKPRKTKYVNF